MTRRAWIQRGIPIAVSVAALAALMGAIEPAKLLGALSWRVAAIMAPAIVAWATITLIIEVISLRLLVDAPRDRFSGWTAAQIKCASYLLGIVHYTLGAAALTVLLRRRVATSLAASASVVLLISSSDLVMTLTLAATGAAFVETGGAVRMGVIAVALLGFVGGLAMLRTPGSLGPLERIRSLTVFDALRRVPLLRLAGLLALRTVFALSFVGMCAAAFFAFDVAPPPALVVAGSLMVALVGALPIAVAGLGTTQLAVVALFQAYAEPEVLVAMSLVLSAGAIVLRALMGFVFAREYTREALAEAQDATA